MKICREFLLSLLQALCFFLSNATAISFIEEPSDVQVPVGGNAILLCMINGTAFTPSWRINGTDYSPSFLPLRHSSSEHGITVTNVTQSDNGVTYQCFLNLRSGKPFESTVGHIVIITEGITTSLTTELIEVSGKSLSVSRQTTTAVAQVLDFEITVPITTTTTTESAIIPVKIKNGITRNSANSILPYILTTESAIPVKIKNGTTRNSANSKLPYILGGSIMGVVVILAILIFLIIVILHRMSKHKQDVKEGNDGGPTYEDLHSIHYPQNITMDSNACYDATSKYFQPNDEQTQLDIFTSQNQCYGQLPNTNLYETIPIRHE